MKTSLAGRRFLAKHEGNKLEAYRDVAGVWTIGVGHTASAGSPRPRKGMRITAEESLEILARDLAKFERRINKNLKVKVTQSEFDALVSFDFNTGKGQLICQTLNTQGRPAAAVRMNKYVKARIRGNLMTVRGLVNRRAAEEGLFLRADYGFHVEAHEMESETKRDVPVPREKPSVPKPDNTVAVVIVTILRIVGDVLKAIFGRKS